MSLLVLSSSGEPSDFALGDDFVDFDFDFAEDNFLLDSVNIEELATSYPCSSPNGMAEIRSDDSSVDALSTSTQDLQSEGSMQKRKARKATSTALVTKRRKGPVPRAKLLPEPLQLGKAPNMSRRGPKSALVVFPTYDKCDSLVFLPNSISRCLNTGDFQEFDKILTSRLDKNCLLVVKNIPLNQASMLTLFEMANDMHPDNITCVHQTQVEGNTITSKMYSKFTDCKIIFDSIAGRMANTKLSCMVSGTRSAYLRQKMDLESREHSEQARLGALADSDADLTVYTTMTLTMKVDEVSGRINCMEWGFEVTSVQPATVGRLELGSL